MSIITLVQAVKIEKVFKNKKWSQECIQKLLDDDILSEVLNVVKGCARIEPIKLIIDCHKDPSKPSDLKIERHIQHGYLEWHPKLIKLYRPRKSKNRKCLSIYQSFGELAKKSVANACVLDFFLGHPLLISDKWKTVDAVYFLGTEYTDENNRPYYRYLFWTGKKWSSAHNSNDCILNEKNKVAIF